MKQRFLRISVSVVVLAMVATAAVACGDDDDDDGGGPTTVNVTLQEFSVIPDQDAVDAGEVEFVAENVGPDDPHELVIIKTDLAPDALPTREDGGVDEDGDGIEIIDEIEEFDVGGSESLTLNLDEGNYVLICNLVEEEEEDGETVIEAHYQFGMRTAFTVD
jgi:hypothetical protein